jgi:GNAT superfamily N-acetyltransferase
VDKLAEVVLAPVGAHLSLPQTRVVEREGWFQLITPGVDFQNEVVHSQVAASDAERVAERTVAEYEADAFRWNVHPLTEPAGFGDILARHDLACVEMRGMAIDPTGWRPSAPRGVTIDGVTATNLADYVAAYARGWQSDLADHVDALAHALATGRFACWLVRVNGEPAGTAGLAVKTRSAYLIGGNVLPEFRGRGVYRALLDARLGWLAARGVRLAATHAIEATSAPILERLGFETVYRSRSYRR